MTKKNKKSTRQTISAFTTVELLLVVVLISLLASLSVPAGLKSYKKMLVEKAAKDLYFAAKYARLIAVEKQTECRLMIDSQNNRFCLTLDSENPYTSDQATVLQNSYTKPTQFDDDIIFEDITITPTGTTDEEQIDIDQIIFRPDGTADSAILPITDGRNIFTVTISAPTAKPKITFGIPENSPFQIVDLDQYQ